MLVRNPFTHDSRVERESRSLASHGYAVTVVADASPGVPAIEERLGVRVIRVKRPRLKVRGARLFAYQRRLESVLERTLPDILHAHDSDALEPVARAARRLAIPFVLDAHELWLGRMPRGRGAVYRALFRAYYAIIERRYVSRAAAHITVSPVIANYLEARYHVPKVALVSNYPEIVEDEAPVDLRSLPGAERVPVGVPLVLHLGSAMAGRGVEQLIGAMTMVPSAHLILLGAGPAGAALMELARAEGIVDRVHVLLPVPTDKVVAAASTATIGVAPIIPDTPNNAASMPNKLFQYLAAGLPVVVSDLPQLRQVVEESGAGIAVDTRDPVALADGIGMLLGDRERLKELGRRAREAAEQRYNWAVAESVLLDVYSGVAQRGGESRRRMRRSPRRTRDGGRTA